MWIKRDESFWGQRLDSASKPADLNSEELEENELMLSSVKDDQDELCVCVCVHRQSKLKSTEEEHAMRFQYIPFVSMFVLDLRLKQDILFNICI